MVMRTRRERSTGSLNEQARERDEERARLRLRVCMCVRVTRCGIRPRTWTTTGRSIRVTGAGRYAKRGGAVAAPFGIT